MAPPGRVPLHVRIGRWAARRLGDDPEAIEAETAAIVSDVHRRIRPADPRRADELAEVYQRVIQGKGD